MFDVAGFNINSSDGLSNDETAMLHTLQTLDKHLGDMEAAGTTVKNIQTQVSEAYRARSSATHAAGIDEWLKTHARITERTRFFLEGTKMATNLLAEAEDESNIYAMNITNTVNPK
ncbi:hypothetical protein OHA63_34610 [Streptomyces anulatus]|uniref:hypothetical protein n=1 Tax=Streptomyces anulatus TaxID=1892 RepID=UPI002E3088EE|nr:hypothetical protein [Streptomyces anulatus]